MEISKDEFIQWKENPVTQQVFDVVSNRIEDAKEILANNAGLEPEADRFYVGMIRAFREVQEISYED